MKFDSQKFKEGEEVRLKEQVFNIKMNPREWMARFGHNIIVGDMRMYKYEDKEFKDWIYKAFEALTKEGLTSLWREFLTDEEIKITKKAYNNL